METTSADLLDVPPSPQASLTTPSHVQIGGS